MSSKAKPSILLVVVVFLALITIYFLLVTRSNTLSAVISQENYSEYKAKVTPEPLNQEVRLLFAGDTMLARSIGDKILEGKNPFTHVQDKFSEYDLVILNLETSVSNVGTPNIGKLYTFQAPVDSIKFMEESGVDLVSLANNHSKDFGPTAFLDMLDRLNNSKLKQFGGGINSIEAFKPTYVEINGYKLAFFGYNDIETNFNAAFAGPGSAWFDKEKISAGISEAKANADFVIPFVHWGTEFSFESNSRQLEFAKLMIDSGSDIVIGAHPHVIQPTEEYSGKKIIYSLGNFVFDQMYLGAAEGNMLEVIINENTINSTSLIPIKINSEGFPEIVD